LINNSNSNRVFVATLIHKTEPGCQTSGCTSQNHNIRETIHPSDTDVENVDPLPPNDANDACTVTRLMICAGEIQEEGSLEIIAGS